MALKELRKPVKQKAEKPAKAEVRVEKFIAKGGSLAGHVAHHVDNDDHRLTLRIPKWLMAKVDVKRKERVGKISRNLWILEIVEKAAK